MTNLSSAPPFKSLARIRSGPQTLLGSRSLNNSKTTLSETLIESRSKGCEVEEHHNSWRLEMSSSVKTELKYLLNVLALTRLSWIKLPSTLIAGRGD